jgi:hypothetical protein
MKNKGAENECASGDILLVDDLKLDSLHTVRSHVVLEGLIPVKKG